DYEVSIAVTQQPKLEYTLEVSPLDFDLSYAAQTKTASVVTNCAPWDAVVSSDASWLTVSLASSTSGKASLTLQVTENTGTAERTGTVTVSTQAPPLEKIITVKQQAKVSASIRYTALVLDITGSMLGTPIQATKQAAIKFCEAAATAKGVNYVALVTYASSASTRVNFTTDTNALTAAINGLSASGGTNTNSGIVRAGELLDAVPGANLIKNIVLMSDGLPNSGITSSTGPYTRSQYGYYGYANAAYNTATGMHKRFSIYTLGFFHSVTSSERSFATLFMSDLQNSGYYEVTNVDDLDFIFGRIANISNSNSYRVIHINCPVDVKVYDSQNALAASIVNEVAEGVINSSVTAQIDEDGQKTFVLPDGEAYSIQITAREDCDMTYSIQEYNRALSQVTRAVNYLDVPLKQSDLYTGQAENLEDTPDAEYQLIDPDGDVVEKSEDLRDGDVITYNVDIQTQGAGTATGEGERVRGEFSQLTAQPTSGAQFLGWYVRNNRVSTDPSFRFCVLANTSLEAIFTSADIQASEITVNVGEGGSVEGGGLYAPNKNVYLIAIPDSDKTFLGWYEGDVKIAGTEELYFEAAEDRTLEARFSYDIPQQKFLLSGKVKSYNPHNPVTLSLQTENEAAKEITIAAEPDAPAGLAEQSFQFIDITPGTYTLYITKPAHVSYTIHNIVVTDADLDLTQDNRDQVKLIAMLVGDLDSDGHINVQDLNTVWSRSNYNKSVATPDVNARCDLDGNGQINVTDLNLLWSRTNYNKSAVVVEYDS
ncbi:MAG: VWA domain-containing protein, partial [Clostridiales bacterium]|nr:VWA domain-containing protein [Clostridiales bacterium]